MIKSWRNRFSSSIALAAVVALAFSACGGGGGGSDEEADSEDKPAPEQSESDAPPAGTSYVAAAKGASVAVFDAADGAETQSLANPIESGAPLVFLVDGTDVDGEWLPVYVPVKPNGTKGWIKAADVDVSPNPYSIEIELTNHHLTLTNGTETVLETEVGLGNAGTETPAGTYYLKELFQPPDPSGPYGPYAYGLSGFSENEDPEFLEQFPGGVVGLHGNNDPSSIGASVSNGCIRLPNDVITQMADILPLGTPVEILA